MHTTSSASSSYHPVASHATAVRAEWAWDGLLLLNRVGLGWYVMNAGWEKVDGELGQGLGTFLNSEAFERRSALLPDILAVPFGYAWPWLELVAGLLVLVGLFTRPMTAVTAWLLLSIGIALLAAGELFPRHHLMVFVPAALLLLALGPGRYAVDSLLHRTARPRQPAAG